MKLRYITFAVVAAGSIAAVSLCDKENIEKTGAAGYKITSPENKVIGSPVFAVIKYNGVLYEDEQLEKPCDYLKTGDRVEILKDKAREIYYIRLNNRLGWTKADILDIPPDPPTLTHTLTDEEIERFANEMSYGKSKYFVWVDIARQKTYVLKRDEGGTLHLERSIVCATGRNQSPTTRGYFKISDRGESFYNKKLGSGARYWVRFNGSYLFHSVALNEDGSVKDDTLGVRRSDGCVRMSMEDIKWFYDTVEEGTEVRVN